MESEDTPDYVSNELIILYRCFLNISAIQNSQYPALITLPFPSEYRWLRAKVNEMCDYSSHGLFL